MERLYDLFFEKNLKRDKAEALKSRQRTICVDVTSVANDLKVKQIYKHNENLVPPFEFSWFEYKSRILQDARMVSPAAK